MSGAAAAAHWVDALAEGVEPCVAVALVRAEGSTPREAGARMLVTRGGVHGTIGGGQLEFKAIELARERLTTAIPAARAVHRFALGPSLGQCCGGAASVVLESIGAPRPPWVAEAAARRRSGEVVVLATPLAVPSEAPRLIGRRDAGCVAGIEGAPAAWRDEVRRLIESPAPQACVLDTADGPVFLERIGPDAFEVMLFGAGHVGRALAAALGLLPCRVTWVDGREGSFPQTIAPNTAVRLSLAPALEVRQAPPSTFFIVMTHSHALDQDICEEVLRRGEFAYLGLIGSDTKRATFERRLRQRGIPAEALERLTCPIGIPGIHGKEPPIIAAAVVAQLVLIRETQLAAAAARPEHARPDLMGAGKAVASP